jgi:predicted transcriptional regulator
MKENLPALRDQDPKTILARYLSDESTKDIAKCYGVTRQALGQYLLKHAESEWKEAQVARAIARKEQAEDDMESIGLRIEGADRDERERLNLTLSLARERLKAAQWDLERVCRRIYGQDSPTTAQAVQININLRRDAAPQSAKDETLVAQVIDSTGDLT